MIGSGTIQVDHLTKFPYITAVLRETLRLQPTAPAISLQPIRDVDTIGGKYTVHHGEPIVALLHKIHRDPAVYGEDANEFKPERMLDEPFSKLPPNSWKPFGNGARGCIGRPFAWQEALIVIAMLLQYFDFSLDNPQYELQLKATLTIKPKDFHMRAKLRHGLTATQLERSLSSSMSGPQANHVEANSTAQNNNSANHQGKPMTVLYGSNTGTCQAFAQRIASDAPAHGFTANVDTLDSAKASLPTDQPVVIITASYEGQPCDNAAHFFNWLESLKEDNSTKISYAVFGAGHSDWKSTFHRIPTAIDNMLSVLGGERICERGGADAAQGDMFSDFENWEETFWQAAVEKYGDQVGSVKPQSLSVEISNIRSSHLRADVYEAKVVDARVLSAPGVPEKRHVEIQLPSDMTYSCGDYLAVLPLNPTETVQRVMRHFSLAWDSVLTIRAATGTILPSDVPISAPDLFGAYVELGQPATKRNVIMLADACSDNTAKEQLEHLAGDGFTTEITEKRVSIIDLLDRFPSVQLPLSNFIASLPPMRTRQYSISSSPLWSPHRVTLTYAVIHQSHISGTGEYVGVASNYLSKLAAGDTLHVSVRPSNQAFHLPTDSEHTPVIMIAAGTGIAPFRGFIQERAAQVAAGRSLAPALLFIGCRDPEKDELYRQDFHNWEAIGAVQIFRTYSRKPEASSGHRYVQDALLAQKEKVLELWDRGSKVYVCGSRGLELSVREVSQKMYIEREKESGKDVSAEDAAAWFEDLRNARFATDVFT